MIWQGRGNIITPEWQQVHKHSRLCQHDFVKGGRNDDQANSQEQRVSSGLRGIFHSGQIHHRLRSRLQRSIPGSATRRRHQQRRNREIRHQKIEMIHSIAKAETHNAYSSSRLILAKHMEAIASIKHLSTRNASSIQPTLSICMLK